MDKIYSPTSHKLESLKRNGLFPFSKLALRSLNLAFLSLTTYFMIPWLTINPNIIAEIINDSSLFSPSIIELIKQAIIFITVSSLSLILSSFIVRFSFSNFLILPLSRYPSGILKLSRKIIFSNFYSHLILKIIIFVLFFGIILFYVDSNNFQKTNSELLPNFFLLSAIFFAACFLIEFYRQKVIFFEQHRMTKAEILQEIKETEGSQVTKQQIRSGN